MKIPECMTRRTTDDESRVAALRLLDAGAYDPEADMPIGLRRWLDGGAYIITEPGNLAGLALAVSAALLDAAERAEKAEADVARLLKVMEEADVLADEAGAVNDDEEKWTYELSGALEDYRAARALLDCKRGV